MRTVRGQMSGPLPFYFPARPVTHPNWVGVRTQARPRWRAVRCKRHGHARRRGGAGAPFGAAAPAGWAPLCLWAESQVVHQYGAARLRGCRPRLRVHHACITRCSSCSISTNEAHCPWGRYAPRTDAPSFSPTTAAPTTASPTPAPVPRGFLRSFFLTAESSPQE